MLEVARIVDDYQANCGDEHKIKFLSSRQQSLEWLSLYKEKESLYALADSLDSSFPCVDISNVIHKNPKCTNYSSFYPVTEGGGLDNIFFFVYIEIPQRGNKELIDKLIDVGFKVSLRKKIVQLHKIIGLEPYKGFEPFKGNKTECMKGTSGSQPESYLSKALSKIAALEKEFSGLQNTHDQLQERFDQLYAANQKMAEDLEKYVSAEREKRLIILPCPLGSEVFTVHEDYFDCSHCEFGNEAVLDPSINQVCCDLPNGRMCPLSIKKHTAKGFTVGVGAYETPDISYPGEFGCEGLETYYGIDGKWHPTVEAAQKSAATYNAAKRIEESW